MAKQHPSSASALTGWVHRIRRIRMEPADSFGLVLVLILLDYLAISTISAYLWGEGVIILLLGSTFVFALQASLSRRVWRLLAMAFLIGGLGCLAVITFVPGITSVGSTISLSAGVLLIVTPIAIVRRIIRHTVVTAETLLGAVAVYLLLGFSFASIYSLIGLFAPSPFFADYPHPEATDYLFFSYTTLTTVGYGNLVPAGNIGRMFSMGEALLGQIYLVIVVARLVSLWGGRAPAPDSSAPDSSAQPDQPDQAPPVALEPEAQRDTPPKVSAAPSTRDK